LLHFIKILNIAHLKFKILSVPALKFGTVIGFSRF